MELVLIRNNLEFVFSLFKCFLPTLRIFKVVIPPGFFKKQYKVVETLNF